ncbi:MAG: hypothetical protein U9N76_01485 [Candidatus Marinimicrobia bacterium]|nr:hypothetical protein [Candidatus Neomarinimicrobiota bacterium]
MNKNIIQIVLFILMIFLIGCSISSKSYVDEQIKISNRKTEKKTEKNTQKIIDQLNEQNTELSKDVIEMQIKIDSLQSGYDKNLLLLTNLTKRYDLLKNEINSIKTRKSYNINTILKKVNSMHRNFQQLEAYIFNNDLKGKGGSNSKTAGFVNYKNEYFDESIDSLFYKYNRLKYEFDLMVLDLTLVEKSVIDIIRYSTNRVKSDITRDINIIENDVNKISIKQDSLFVLYKGISDSNNINFDNNGDSGINEFIENDTLFNSQNDSLKLNDSLKIDVK